MVSTLERNQAARRERVMQAALELAADGGLDGVQMRDVAERADVALGTLYRYFPSKEYLLVSILKTLVDGHIEGLRQNPPSGDTPEARVMEVLRRAVPLHPERDVFEAMVRALASADDSISDIFVDINASMTVSLTGAMAEGEPTERDLAVARILQQVWLAAAIGWIGGLEGKNRIIEDLEVAVALLIGTDFDREA